MSELLNYQLSLRIRHPSAAATMISHELNLVPEHAYTAGDRKLTPKGTVVPGRPRSRTFWVHRIACADESLEDALATLTSMLANKRDFLRQLVATGGRVEYFIGLFAGRGSGVEISSGLMARLVDLGVDLSFDIYGQEYSGGVSQPA